MPTINGKACVANRKNLYIDATDFNDPDLWPNFLAWTKTGEKFNGLTVLKTNHNWEGLAQVVQAKKGETYTFSVYARYESGTGKSMIFSTQGGSSTGVVQSNFKVSLNETWQRVTSTMTITSDGSLYTRIERGNDTTNNLLIAGPKLERGATATPLTPASVDKVFSNGRQVYGRNLASGTGQEYVMGHGIPNTVWQDGYAYENLPTPVYGNTEILPQDPYSFQYAATQGVTYTQTIWFETDATVKDLSAAKITWYTSGAGHDMQPATVVNLGGNKYKLYSTYTCPGDSGSHVRLFDIFNLPSAFNLSTGTYFKFGKLKLEEGKVSTPWTPAPEDVM